MTARPPVTRDLARLALTETDAAAARATARRSAFDMLAVGLAGRDEPVAAAARAIGRSAGRATALGISEGLGARDAALVNGATGHALDYDDTQFEYVGHPSVAVFPAAWAVAETEAASGRALIDAFLAGAEAACRLGAWLGAAHYNLGFHQTGTAGTFGATAAAGRLMGLDAETMAHALGIAATMAGGLKSQFGTMGKPLNAGIAAANGVRAAELARAGLRSRTDGIECAQGFAETHGGCGDAAGWAASAAEIGRIWRFERVRYKRHACCHGLHAALEALGGLRPEIGDPARVTAVEIRTAPRWLRVCDIAEPRTGLEAKFSYRLTAAMALRGVETAALESYSEAACADPGLVALRDVTRAVGDAALSDTETAVRVTLTDGAALTATHDLAAETPGDALDAQLRAKAATLLGAERAARLWAVAAAAAGDDAPGSARRLREALPEAGSA